MKQITVTDREAGERLDRLLTHFLRDAPKGFLYKMMRKKNITLDGKKAQGSELLQPGSVIRVFLADETWEKFGGVQLPEEETGIRARKDGDSPAAGSGKVPVLEPGVRPPLVLYEDRHILLFNKPAGILSQKASPQDISLVEYLTAYLLDSGQLTKEELQVVHPAVCSRLDRNTSGIVAAGKTVAGLRALNGLLQDRSLRKYYRCVVCGTLQGEKRMRGWLRKDGRTNQVSLSDYPVPGAKQIETEYRVLASREGLTLLEVHLITGRSHQIRAHLSAAGYPILGDPKYGDAEANRRYRASHGVTAQLLHAYRLEFPQELPQPLDTLRGRSFFAPLPAVYEKLTGGR